MAEFNNEYRDLQTVRDTQDEYVRQAQEDSDAIKCGTENFRMRTEFTMNEEQVAHQSRILEYNERTKSFDTRKKQFEAEEVQRLLCKAEWQQRVVAGVAMLQTTRSTESGCWQACRANCAIAV